MRERKPVRLFLFLAIHFEGGGPSFEFFLCWVVVFVLFGVVLCVMCERRGQKKPSEW